MKGFFNMENHELPKDMKWCEHLHNWGNAFYFVDCHTPFNIDQGWLSGFWHICPICKTERPIEWYEWVKDKK